MKLSKEEFLEVLMEAAHHTSKINGQKCVEIHDALLDNALEIDGYERVQWTRFDWDNPKTYPANLGKYLVRYSFGKTGIEKWEGENLGFVSSDRRYITHWLPLPKPPQEEKND